jgi:hypothetical protein
MNHLLSIPEFKVIVRAEYLYNLQSHHGETVAGLVHSVKAMAGRALGFNVLLESGACFWNLPVSAFLFKKSEGPLFELDELELWDCLDDKVCVEIIKFLQYKRCTVKMKSGIIMPARYRMTFDWWEGAWAQMPDEQKCYHLLEIDNGQMVLYPNNHILWHDQTIVTGSGKPDYKVNQQLYSSENSGKKVVVENTDDLFYGLSDLDAARLFAEKMRQIPIVYKNDESNSKRNVRYSSRRTHKPTGKSKGTGR